MKWYWILLLGGVLSYFIHKTATTYGWIIFAITSLLAFFQWKKG